MARVGVHRCGGKVHARRGSDTAAEACVAILIAGTTLDGFTTWNEKINHRCLRGPPSASQQQVPPGAQQSEAFVNGLNEPSLPQAACLALGLEQHQDVALTNRPLCTQHTRTRTSAHASASYPPHPFPAHNPPTPHMFPSSDHTVMCHRNRTRQPQHLSPCTALLPAIHYWLHGTPTTKVTASARRPGILRWNVRSTGP